MADSEKRKNELTEHGVAWVKAHGSQDCEKEDLDSYGSTNGFLIVGEFVVLTMPRSSKVDGFVTCIGTRKGQVHIEVFVKEKNLNWRVVVHPALVEPTGLMIPEEAWGCV